MRNVLVVVFDGFGKRCKCAYVLSLGLFQDACDVFGNVFAEREDGAVAYGSVGAEEG